jgi:hypothetical protein
MDRGSTPLVESYRRYISNPVAAIGEWTTENGPAFTPAAEHVA